LLYDNVMGDDEDGHSCNTWCTLVPGCRLGHELLTVAPGSLQEPAKCADGHCLRPPHS
jgi:hypothetical protein